MAAKRDDNLQSEIGRDLCRVRTEGGIYRGYKKDILTDNLSERDNAIFVCPRCEGILRELCLSAGGEQFCSCCKKEGEQTNLNVHMNNMILCFKCCCPLMVRGCGWLGTLGDCEIHLDTCGYVQEKCKLKCGVVLQRNNHVTHEKENCIQRIVKCEHCKKNFKFCELTEHLNVCPKMKVSCELKCGVVMCRDKVTQHLEKECGQVEENCKLGCGLKLTRDELTIHVTDECVQRLVVCEHCKENFKFCELTEHLDVCPKMKVSCKLKCGVMMCRDKVTQHIDHECREKEIECPFVKYKCVGLIKRQNLNTHLEENETEHLKMKLNTIEDIVMKQSEMIEKQNVKIIELGEMVNMQNRVIETMSRDIISLKKCGGQFQKQMNPIKFHWEIAFDIRNSRQHSTHEKEFDANGYLIQFNLIHCNGSLLMDFCLKDGVDYDRLDWPFRAKFAVQLIASSHSARFPPESEEIRSEVIEVERKDLASNFRIAAIPITMPMTYHPLRYILTPELKISIFFC